MTAIQDKYNSLPINLGAPISEEESLPDGGTKQHFEFGSIYFHPRIGEAFECHGLILQTYIQMGEEQSDLGYPVTDEMDNPAVDGGRMNGFEFGRLFWEFTHGVILELDEELSLAPQVVVKLHDDVPVNLGQGETLSLDGLEAILGSSPFIDGLRILLPDLLFRRVFDSVSPQVVQDLVDQALSHDPDYSPPNFVSFLAIDCPIGFDTEQLVAVLNLGIGVVEYAYTVPQASDPNIVGTTNPLFSRQTYLGSSTTNVSINVQTAWAMGADGAGLIFIDIEQGWLLSHVDLPFGIPKLDGIIRKKSRAHGCAVLGVVVGVDNDQGIVGIAPRADARVISYYHPRYRLPDMIMLANDTLREGDVLLLEVSLGMQVQALRAFVPAEAADPAVFEAIRLATKKGIIVVEAAGNSGVDLDGLNDAGNPILPRDPSHDSGAILVGACHADLPYRRWTTPVTFGPSFGSNFGSRVDCSCIGEFIVSAGSQRDEGDITLYSTGPHYFEDFFGGTSGASAIIAGVCLLIQDLQSKLFPLSGIIGPLRPLQMRNMINNPQNGTTSPPSDKIGVLPDFQKIIANEYEIPIL
jgi:hypothetical protein